MYDGAAIGVEAVGAGAGAEAASAGGRQGAAAAGVTLDAAGPAEVPAVSDAAGAGDSSLLLLHAASAMAASRGAIRRRLFTIRSLCGQGIESKRQSCFRADFLYRFIDHLERSYVPRGVIAMSVTRNADTDEDGFQRVSASALRKLVAGGVIAKLVRDA